MPERVNSATDWRNFYWYHCIDLGNGIVTEGDYNLRPLLPMYRFPDDMSGLRVLDVGRASGFFSFEFEHRGAQVTATELASFFDWDFVGGAPARDRRIAAISDVAAFTEHQITGAFHFAHAARGSKVKAVTANIYDIAPDKVPGSPFDLVFCGSILSHLRDPMRALASLRSVTAPDGLCIVAAPFLNLKDPVQYPTMWLITGDDDGRSWWTMNKVCLVAMLRAAGFATAEIVSEFDLDLKRAGRVYPHVVAHARP